MRTTNVYPRSRGFTLVELLIVIIIIAVLAAIAIPKFNNATVQSKDSSLRADLTLYRNAIESYKNDTGALPAVLTDLSSTTAIASGLAPWNGTSGGGAQAIVAANWKGPYLNAQENDPVSGVALHYDVSQTATVGTVTSTATGNDPDNVPYANY